MEKGKLQFDLQLFAVGVLTYDPKKVAVIFGAHQITGFSEDDIITVSPSGEGMQKYVGADGEVARSVDPNETFEITFSLASTSRSNTYLSNMYNLDRVTGKAMVPLLIKDLSGDTVFAAEQAWVQNFPECTKGRVVETQEWTIDTGQVRMPVAGGNY